MGDLVSMEEQDRAHWDQAMVTAGLAALAAARASGRPPGPYRLQAEIAALNATAATAAETNWAGVVAGYEALFTMQQSPVVALNRAVALGFRDGPQAGLDALGKVDSDPRLASYWLRPAARADFLRRAGRTQEAAAAYGEALALVRTDSDRRFLERRMREILGQT